MASSRASKAVFCLAVKGGDTRLPGVAEGVAHLDSEALKLEDQGIERGVQEAGGDQIGEFLIGQTQALRQSLGGLQLRLTRSASSL